MWESQLQRHLKKNPPKEGDRFMVVADGAFMAYKRTERAATMLLKKLADSGRFASVEWSRVG